MKLAWVTPYNTRSAIGRFSRMIVSGLGAADHVVTMVRCEAVEVLNATEALPGAELVRWDEVCSTPDFLSSFDAVVYNIGNHYPFHAGALELLHRFPGVVIFHDYFLLDLFRGWCAAMGSQGLGDRIVDDLYGEGAALRLHAVDGGPDFWEYASEHFPMTEWIGRLAHGAVAHSSFYAERLRHCCGGPVTVMPLAYDALADFQPLAGRKQSSNVNILTIGHINQNKRVGIRHSRDWRLRYAPRPLPLSRCGTRY